MKLNFAIDKKAREPGVAGHDIISLVTYALDFDTPTHIIKVAISAHFGSFWIYLQAYKHISYSPSNRNAAPQN